MISRPMKPILTLLLGLALSSAGWSQSIPLSELLGPQNQLRDPVYGVAVKYPAGWQVRGASRWGKNNAENTVMFQPTWPFESRPSLYYQPTTNFGRPAAGQEEAHFRYTAGTKAASRVQAGLRDYKNLENTFTFTQINGRPAFRYFAQFTREGKPQFEYFVRVIGEKMMVMFFTMGPITELEIMAREVDEMSATVLVP